MRSCGDWVRIAGSRQEVSPGLVKDLINEGEDLARGRGISVRRCWGGGSSFVVPGEALELKDGGHEASEAFVNWEVGSAWTLRVPGFGEGICFHELEVRFPLGEGFRPGSREGVGEA